MLIGTPAERVAAAARAYLHEALGIMPEVRAWADVGKLPYFLTETFEVRELLLLDRDVLLAIDERGGRAGLADIRGQIEKLRRLAGMPVVYVTRALASYERKRLIEHKVPFLVPGNQLYLPEIGIDLREYFRKPATRARPAVSPATQAMLISVLLRRPWHPEWQPAEMLGDLGYTAMTLSRAVEELTAAGLATLRVEGRSRWLRAEPTAAETWERAKPLLRSPVKRRVWVLPPPEARRFPPRLAGESALARMSMLAEPRWPIYAIGPADWRAAVKGGVELLPEPMPEACEWEIWSYSPGLAPDGDLVDPLSLGLSLQGVEDERVQRALDGLEGRFPW